MPKGCLLRRRADVEHLGNTSACLGSRFRRLPQPTAPRTSYAAFSCAACEPGPTHSS